MRDAAHNLHILRAIAPVSVADNAPQVGQVIDTKGYRSLTFAIATGAIADTDATFGVQVDHGDAANLADAAAAPDADLIGLETQAGFQFDDDNETRKIGYVGNKRYARLTITPVNNASAALLSAVAILGTPQDVPTANPPV
jgi:hypothetical protein